MTIRRNRRSRGKPQDAPPQIMPAVVFTDAGEDPFRPNFPNGGPVAWHEFAAWRDWVAEQVTDDEVRDTMLAIARSYDEMADKWGRDTAERHAADFGVDADSGLPELIAAGYCEVAYRTPNGTSVVYMTMPTANRSVAGVFYAAAPMMTLRTRRP